MALHRQARIRDRAPMSRSRCDGSVLVVVLVGASAMLLLVALVLDLGLAFSARQQLQSVADSAARGALAEGTRSGQVGS